MNWINFWPAAMISATLVMWWRVKTFRAFALVLIVAFFWTPTSVKEALWNEANVELLGVLHPTGQ